MESVKEKLEKCMGLTVDLVNAHHELPKDKIHPSDIQEMVRDIHNIQNRLLAIANQNNIFLKTGYETN